VKANRLMQKLLENNVGNSSLSPVLREIVDCGFENQEDCFFLKALLSLGSSVTRNDFQDCTAYECFINSVHVEDYDENNPLGQAVALIRYVFDAWRLYTPVTGLIAVVSVDEYSVVTKFHANRTTEQWLSSDIEDYDDPVLSIESSEDLVEFLDC